MQRHKRESLDIWRLQLLQLEDAHLLVFVADGAEPLVAGQHVVLAAVLAHPHIAAPATRTQGEHCT